jgi:hypothetical protein
VQRSGQAAPPPPPPHSDLKQRPPAATYKQAPAPAPLHTQADTTPGRRAWKAVRRKCTNRASSRARGPCHTWESQPAASVRHPKRKTRLLTQCSCGESHEDVSRRTKAGWVPDGNGNALRVALCRCGRRLDLDVIKNASVCELCTRLVTGHEGDIKISLCERDSFVMCLGCFCRYALEAGV